MSPFSDERIETQFGLFQGVLRAVREIRDRQNVPPKTKIAFSVRCDEATAELLRPMERYFESMAGARPTGWGADVERPALAAHMALTGMEVFVDLAELIDVEAETAKKRQELEKLDKLIAGKRGKLANETFTSRAPAEVVQKERDQLAEFEAARAATVEAITMLRKLSGQ